MRRPDTHIRTFVASFLLFLMAAASWAMATPLAGSPDEPAHIIRAAAVAHGQLLPEGNDEVGRGYFEVPASLERARDWEDCFAHKAQAGAACQPPIPTTPGMAQASTTASAYNPVYYAMVGWPSLFVDDAYGMVYFMRLLTAIVNSLLLAATTVFLSMILGLRRTAVVMAATVTPMLLFLGGAVNPNAWEISGGMALLAAALAIGHRPDGQATAWPALATIAASGALVANLRGVSPLWVAVLGLLGLLAIPRDRLRGLVRGPGMWITLGVVSAGVVCAVLWGRVAGAFALEGDFANKDWPALRVIDFMLRRTIFEHAYVGLFGWTDTAAPLIAVIILGGLGVLIVAAAFAVGRGRLLVLTCAAIAIWLVAPALIQLWYVRTAGIIWQGRYTMVMYVAVIILSAVTVNAVVKRTNGVLDRRVGWVFGIAVTFAHAYTFLYTELRYAEGLSGTLIGAFVTPAWGPPGGALLWFLLTCAACVGFTHLTMKSSRDPRPEPDPIRVREFA